MVGLDLRFSSTHVYHSERIMYLLVTAVTQLSGELPVGRLAPAALVARQRSTSSPLAHFSLVLTRPRPLAVVAPSPAARQRQRCAIAARAHDRRRRVLPMPERGRLLLRQRRRHPPSATVLLVLLHHLPASSSVSEQPQSRPYSHWKGTDASRLTSVTSCLTPLRRPVRPNLLAGL